MAFSTSVLPAIHDPLILATLASEVGLEEWRDVPGYESQYQVSNLGRVKSKERVVAANQKGDLRTLKEKLLNPSTRTRYPQVKLCLGEQRHTVRVHKLVLLAFAGSPSKDKPIVLHGVNNRRNNCLYNLRYGTQQENLEDQEQDGTRPKGEASPASKLTEADVLKIRSLHSANISIKEIAQHFSVTSQNIRAILRGQTWSHI